MKAVIISIADQSAEQTRKTTVEYTDRPDPELQTGQLLIKVAASAIQPSDLLNSQGNFPQTTFPRIPGRDFAGVVIQPTSSQWHGKAVYAAWN
jgi:NADPH:quinone reductase